MLQNLNLFFRKLGIFSKINFLEIPYVFFLIKNYADWGGNFFYNIIKFTEDMLQAPKALLKKLYLNTYVIKRWVLFHKYIFFLFTKNCPKNTPFWGLYRPNLLNKTLTHQWEAGIFGIMIRCMKNELIFLKKSIGVALSGGIWIFRRFILIQKQL